MDDEEEWVEPPMRTEEEIAEYLNEALDKVETNLEKAKRLAKIMQPM